MAEEDPWGFDDAAEESTPAATAATEAGAPAAGVAPPAAGGDAAPGAEPLPEADVDDENYRKPVQLYKHWVRPKFLQYKYMYDYRTNYYDDVINYLDKRSKGLKPEVPRAQYWAERVLRTHTNTSALEYYRQQKREDKHLIQTIASSIKTHNYHTRAYINRKYSSVL